MKTISLKTAQTLHALGVVGESDYYWFQDHDGSWVNMTKPDILACYELSPGDFDDQAGCFRAYTLDELLEVMPVRLDCEKLAYEYTLDINLGIRIIRYINLHYNHVDGTLHQIIYDRGSNPTEAAGLMVKWLAENGHLNNQGE